MGQIIKGSPNVKVNGIPVGRVGDATLDSGGVSSVAGLTGGSNGVISTTDLQTALSLGSAAQLSTGTGADQIPTTADADSRYAQRSNNLSDLTNVATAVSNLRLANVATSGSYVDLNNKPTSWSWNVITSTPTTLAGYGIVDAVANSQVGVANGITPLGADAKISTTYMPTAVLGQVSYQGTWDASTGSPPTTTPTKGWYYIVTVSGSTNLSGITDWVVGDWAIYNGTAWNKVDNTDAVSSVAGLVGVISTASLQTALGLSTVATSGNYADLIGKPVLATVATTGNYADLNGKPTLGTAASQDTTAFATAAQGAKADTSAQLPAAVTDFTGLVRAGAYQQGNLPTAGVGTEIYYNPSDDTCNVLAYDRGASAYKVLYIKGATIKFAISGTNYVTIDGNGVNLTTGRFSGICKFDVVPNVQSAAANGTYYRMPRVFVQSADPGGNAYDGDLWFW